MHNRTYIHFIYTYGGVSRNLQIAFSVESLTNLLIVQRQTCVGAAGTTTARVGAVNGSVVA